MIKVEVIKDNVVVQTVNFEDETVKNDWLQMLVDTKAWGEDYQITHTDITDQLAKQKAINDAQAYLNSTDFHAIRVAEGYPMDEEIKHKREDARITLRTLNAHL